MNDNPTEIAEHLVNEHGMDGALRTAIDGTADANAENDMYRLSIWRDVKRILKVMTVK